MSKKIYRIVRLSRFSWYRMSLALFPMLIGGVIVLKFISAAGTPIAFEAESGALSLAKTVATAGASGGSAVQFGSTSTTAPTPTPTGLPPMSTYPASYPANCGVDGEVSTDVFKDKVIPGFPTVCTTGWWHTGVTLATINGDLTASTAGQTIDGKLVTGDILINADNVHVTRTWAQNRIFVLNAHKGLVVTDTEIGPPNHNARVSGDVGHGGIGINNYTCIRCYIHTHSDLTWINGNVDIEDSLALNPFILVPPAVSEANADHADGAQASGGSGNVTLRHNYIDIRAVNVNDLGGTAIIWADSSDGTVTIDDNVFAGGSWNMSLHENGHFNITSNKYINNSYEYGIFYLTNGIVNTCTGNTIIDDSGNTVGNTGC